jgi:hypothetical protein
VLAAAFAVLPLLALHLTRPHGALAEGTVVFVVAGMLATFGVSHLRRRAAAEG